MKASTLIQHLVAAIARQGDAEVFIASGEAGHYAKLPETKVCTSQVQKKVKTMSVFVDAALAGKLGYDPNAGAPSITLG